MLGIPSKYTEEQLEIFRFFELGYYWRFSFWRDGMLIENQLEHHFYELLTVRAVEAAILRKRASLANPVTLWSWFPDLDLPTQERFIAHLEEQRLLAERYEPIMRRLQAGTEPLQE